MAKKRKPKRPSSLFAPIARKQPVSADFSDSESLHPAWQVSRLELCDPFGWHTLDESQLDSIREKLAHFESMTWNEILVQAKKRNHTVSYDRLSTRAQNRLLELAIDDAEQLVSLRLTGRQRIWGIKQHNILVLLWWDPNHQVCPARKRKT